MRRCYLLCYDIREQRRLRQVHRIAKAYGESWQYSVFYCVLSEIDRVRLERDLLEIINLKQDQILIIDLGPHDDALRDRVCTLGPSLPEPDGRVVII